MEMKDTHTIKRGETIKSESELIWHCGVCLKHSYIQKRTNTNGVALIYKRDRVWKKSVGACYNN